MCLRRTFRGSLVDLPTWVRLTRPSSLIQGQEIFRLTAQAERICTLAFASTRWLPSSTDSLYPRCEHLARVSSYSATTRVRRFGWRRSWNCPLSSFLRMTPWETERMARLTNRSSTSYHCGQYQG